MSKDAEPQQVEEVEEEEFASQASLFRLRSAFTGHTDAVEAIKVDQEHEKLVTVSRDKTALVWKVVRSGEKWAVQETRFCGHNHFVSGCSLSQDSTHLLTSSWDGTLRLWDLGSRSCKKLFLGHTKDVLDCSFSQCNRIVVSVSRDKSVRIWNILGHCKAELKNNSWATSVACAPMNSPDDKLTLAVSFWDGTVKIWDITENCELKHTIKTGTGRCTSLSFTPDGKWLVTGTSDRKVHMYMVESGEKIMTFTAPAPVNAIAASPTQAWICAATYEGIAVWDIPSKQQVDQIQPNFPKRGKREAGRTPDCKCLAWAADGSVLYAGYNDGSVRAWEVKPSE